MTIADWKRLRRAYIKAREQFLSDYDDVVGVGYGLREAQPVITILVRKKLPIDKSFFKDFLPQQFEGFTIVPREPRNNHDDLMIINWRKVYRNAAIMKNLADRRP